MAKSRLNSCPSFVYRVVKHQKGDQPKKHCISCCRSLTGNVICPTLGVTSKKRPQNQQHSALSRGVLSVPLLAPCASTAASSQAQISILHRMSQNLIADPNSYSASRTLKWSCNLCIMIIWFSSNLLIQLLFHLNNWQSDSPPMLRNMHSALLQGYH